jgi:hypothetical protein
MRHATTLLVALLLAVPHPLAFPLQHPPSTTDVGKQKQKRELDSRLLLSARSLCVLAPGDASLAEIVKKLIAWGRLSIVSKPDGADLVLEMRRIEVVSAFSSLGSDDFQGYPFSASVKHRLSGVQAWSTRAASLPSTDWDGVWAARAIADEFIKYFDRAVPTHGK